MPRRLSERAAVRKQGKVDGFVGLRAAASLHVITLFYVLVPPCTSTRLDKTLLLYLYCTTVGQFWFRNPSAMVVPSTALLGCSALLLLSASDIVDGAEDFLTKATESESVAKRNLVHSAAFTQQLRLLSPDASIEQLALTEEDVQFFGVTVDECEFRHQGFPNNATRTRAQYS